MLVTTHRDQGSWNRSGYLGPSKPDAGLPGTTCVRHASAAWPKVRAQRGYLVLQYDPGCCVLTLLGLGRGFGGR